MKEIADRIKEARLAKGMTQDELAKALGLKSRSSINKMEKDAYEVGLDRLKEIARVLEVDPDYLVFGNTEDKKEEINVLFRKLTEAQQDAAIAFLRSMIENAKEPPRKWTEPRSRRLFLCSERTTGQLQTGACRPPIGGNNEKHLSAIGLWQAGKRLGKLPPVHAPGEYHIGMDNPL